MEERFASFSLYSYYIIKSKIVNSGTEPYGLLRVNLNNFLSTKKYKGFNLQYVWLCG